MVIQFAGVRVLDKYGLPSKARYWLSYQLDHFPHLLRSNILSHLAMKSILNPPFM